MERSVAKRMQKILIHCMAYGTSAAFGLFSIFQCPLHEIKQYVVRQYLKVYKTMLIEKWKDYYDAFYDLKEGVYRDFPGIETIQKFVGLGCAVKGVLKLTFNKHIASHQRLLIDFYLSEPQGWTRNVGDSITNNGWGDDAGTQSRDAELQFHDNTLSGYFNKHYDSGKAFGIPMNQISRLTCMVANEFSVCFSDCKFQTASYYRSPGWFALDGQSDTIGSVDYDLYLGINGVVAMGRRVGSGVCKVGLKYATTLGN